MMRSTALRVAAAAVLLTATVRGQGNTEEFARRQYESGLAFIQNHRYAEALKDFQAVVDSFPKSSVADNALLQIALYHLEVAHDLGASQAAIDRLLKEYPETDSAAMAHVVAGRLTMAHGHAPADVDAALASFERVRRLFPGDDAVPTADYYAAESLTDVRRLDDALAIYLRITMEYPGSIWAARAAIGGALCLVQSGNALAATGALQRVRQQFPSGREATDALNENTIIYRLYVRQPSQPAYKFAGRYVGAEAAKFRDVVGVTVDADSRVLLAHKLGVAIFDAKATLVKSVTAEEPSAMFVDDRQRVTVVRRNQLIADGGETTPIVIPTPDGKGRQVEEIPSVVVLPNGDRLIADRKGKAVIRVAASGKFVGNFATGRIERLALNRLSDVAMIDKDENSITIVDRDGKALGKIPQKGTGYELDNPVDLAFDRLGHLYVLDRGRASVYVFGPKNRLIATITVPEKEPGAFQKAQAFALDGTGRLYIFDERAQRIQVYQ